MWTPSSATTVTFVNNTHYEQYTSVQHNRLHVLIVLIMCHFTPNIVTNQQVNYSNSSVYTTKGKIPTRKE